MDQIGKFIASAAVMFLFMFSLIFCFDSPDTLLHNIFSHFCNKYKLNKRKFKGS